MDLYGIFTYKFGEPNQQNLMSAEYERDWSNTILKNDMKNVIHQGSTFSHKSVKFAISIHVLHCLILPNTIYGSHIHPWTLWTSSMWLLKIHDRVPLVPQIPGQQVHQSGYIDAHHRKFRSLVGHLFRCFPYCPIHHLFGIPATTVVFLFFWTPLGPMRSPKTRLLDHGVMVRKATASTAPWYFFQPCQRVVKNHQSGVGWG